MSTRNATASVQQRPDGGRKRRHRRNAAAIAMVERWLADGSGYDEETWDTLKAAMKESRRTSRSPFRD